MTIEKKVGIYESNNYICGGGKSINNQNETIENNNGNENLKSDSGNDRERQTGHHSRITRV